MNAKLPENWLNIELGDAVDIYDGERKPINSSERTQRISGKDESELYPYYGATGQVGWIDEYLSNKESVLLGEDGAPFLDPYKDKAYLVRGEFWVNNHAHILRGPEGKVDNRYVCYQLNVLDYSDFVSGTTRLKLTKSSLLKLPFILCSYNEQIRIVEKIEELLSDLDNGVAELKAAQTKLTQYRQSLLKSAVEGALTQQWRETHKPKETGTQLLKRIFIERRKRWEESKLEEFKEKGKKPPKDWQKKYPEPVAPDSSELPDLPEGWVWASLSYLVEVIQIGPFGSLLHKNDYIKNGVPLVNPSHIKNLKIIPDFNLTVGKEKLKKLQNYVMKENDIVIGRRGEMGRCAVVTSTENGWLCGTGSLFVRLLPGMNSYFYSWVLSSKRVKDYLSEFSVGTTMQNLNQKILHLVPVPLCPSNEQFAISELLEMEYERIDAQIESISSGLKQTEAQRKNILKSAFSGELVEQDPGDEPASVLLERIKAEREERTKQVKPKRVKKKTSTMPKIDSHSVKDWIGSLAKDKFSFEDIQSAVGGDYETIKDVIFSILSESNAPIAQVFDKPEIGIQFKKVSR